MRKCRFCAEDIQDAAIVCKHCGRDLIPGRTTAAKDVNVTGVDPLAAYHTPIKGKSKGKLTVIGYLGIVIGMMMFLLVFATPADQPEQALLPILMGLGFIVGSYLWARR
jgi:hypothetical protein